MAQHQKPALQILRMKQIRAQFNIPPSTIYDHIEKGLFVKFFKLGERISGVLESEVTAIMAARISGKSEAEIKALVLSLENQRMANWG
jgi:prophage regulatory protein